MTTNVVNNKIYIGKHQTKDLEDTYLGSGRLLKRAIKKYGRSSFKRDILFVFDNERDMNLKEREIVTEEFCLEDTNYNLCSGGQGGFSYINSRGLNKFERNDEYRLKISEKIKQVRKDFPISIELQHQNSQKGKQKQKELYPEGLFKGRTHSDETRLKMSLAHKKIGNGHRGLMWITDGLVNRKILADTPIPDGWLKGRTFHERRSKY